jgi:DNA (cytosine-5)-methyltransferase 1
MKKIKCLSLFCSGGLAETYFEEIGIEVVLANEKDPIRCKFYKNLYPNTEIICGDIRNNEIRNTIIQKAKEYGVDFIIATPPCQGMSKHGKREENDPRNSLINYAIEVIQNVNPKIVLLENVPAQLKTKIKFNDKQILIPEYIISCLKNNFKIYEDSIFNSADFGVPQNRIRSIFRMVNKDLNVNWERPEKSNKVITLEDAIGHLPSLDPLIRQTDKQKYFSDYGQKKEEGQKISKWHYPPTHSWHHIKWMMHTPSGKSAFENKIYFPQKENGELIKGRISTYKRYRWDKPANTITQNNGVISSSVCVHPGRIINTGKTESERIYSDCRVLTIYELMIISSLPPDWNIPDWADEKLIRSLIGEGVPPLLVKRILDQIIKLI